LILDHFWTEHSVEIRFQPQKVSKPSLLPRAARSELELHLRVLLEDFRLALSKHLRAPQGRVQGFQRSPVPFGGHKQLRHCWASKQT
jgi:hypothetical protein